MSNDGTVPLDEETGERGYPYPPTGEVFTRVTTVLSATEGKPWLPGWASGITAGHILGNLKEFTGLVKTLGLGEATEIAKAESERIRGIKRDTGGHIHNVARALVYWSKAGDAGAMIPLPLLPEHLAGQLYDDDPVEQVADWMTDGWMNWVSDFRPRFLAAEMIVFHPGLKIAGTLDGIVDLPGLAIGGAGRLIPGDGVPVCVDIKTGKHLSVTWPEQIGTYRRCPQCLVGPNHLEPTPYSKAGAVLHLRPPSEPGYERGYRFMLIAGEDDEAAWERFQAANLVYQGRRKAKAKPGKVCYPLRADGTIQPPRISDLDGEGYGRVLSPLVKAGISDLEKLAAMSAGDLLKVKGIGKVTLNTARVMLADHGLHLAGEPLSGGCGYCRAGHHGRCGDPFNCGCAQCAPKAKAAALWRSGTRVCSATRNGPCGSVRSAWAPPSRSRARTGGNRNG
jgi:hypothetical protein